MQQLSADNRLRQTVSAQDGIVILTGAGNVDRVIQFTRLPECLVPFKTKKEGKSVFPVVLNLDRGPHQEAWRDATREAFLSARRDRPMPEPLPVAATNAEGWSVGVEDVPLVEMEDKPSDEKTVNKCETCTMEFRTPKALSIHKTRVKHN